MPSSPSDWAAGRWPRTSSTGSTTPSGPVLLVIGLEIKRELLTGELRQPRAAALPAVAALGGMVVPALL